MNAYFSLAQFYDALTEDISYDAFADYYEQIFNKRAADVKTILDLACGTGTLTCLLAKRGYELIGTDASDEMLSVALEKSLNDCPAIPPMWLNQTMQELDLYGTVDAAVCSLDGINYVNPNELDTVFSRLRLFVRPGGLFIFDINTPYKLESLDGQVYVDENENVMCLWRTEYDSEENACYYGMDIFSKADEEGVLWERSFEEHIEYAHTPDMLKEKLTVAGFGNISVLGELNMQPPTEQEQRIFIVAERI